jgi:hypothetical protein
MNMNGSDECAQIQFNPIQSNSIHSFTGPFPSQNKSNRECGWLQDENNKQQDVLDKTTIGTYLYIYI